MKTFRPIYLEKCAICGEEFDKLYMHEIFTGRKQYICRECYARGEKEIANQPKAYHEKREI